MQKSSVSTPVVLSPEKIKQKLAGYLANYNRKVNSASAKEKKALEESRGDFMKEREKEIFEANRKAVQRRAGYLSWETRKKNLAEKKNEVECTCVKKSRSENPKKRYGSSMSVCVLNNSKKK